MLYVRFQILQNREIVKFLGTGVQQALASDSQEQTLASSAKIRREGENQWGCSSSPESSCRLIAQLPQVRT